MRRGAAIIAVSFALTSLGCAASSRSLPPGAAEGRRPAWFPSARCQETRPANRAGCYKPWTVLVQMAADNDLIPYAYLNLYEMEAREEAGPPRASTERTDVVVQLDTPRNSGLRRLHMLPGTARYDESLTLQQFAARRPKDLESPVIEEVAERADAAAELRDFLDWGVRRYPAERYMIVVWGHGQGWAPAQAARAKPKGPPVELPEVPTPKDDPFAGSFRGGLAFDWTQRTFLDVPAVAAALQGVRKATGRPVDIFAADACLMQMTEVATEIGDSARFIVSSAYLQDFVGLPYRAILGRLNSEGQGSLEAAPADPARQLATAIPELFEDSLDPAKNALRGKLAADLRQRFTLSTVAGEELGRALLPALAEVGAGLVAYQDEDPANLRSGDLAFLIGSKASLFGSIQDLGSFLGALQAHLASQVKDGAATGPVTERLQGAVARAREALDGAVPAYRFGSDYRGEGLSDLGLHALSAWLPISQSDRKTRIADYRASALYHYGAQGSGPGPWQRWIERLRLQ